MFSEVTLFEYNVSTILSPMVAYYIKPTTVKCFVVSCVILQIGVCTV